MDSYIEFAPLLNEPDSSQISSEFFAASKSRSFDILIDGGMDGYGHPCSRHYSPVLLHPFAPCLSLESHVLLVGLKLFDYVWVDCYLFRPWLGSISDNAILWVHTILRS